MGGSSPLTRGKRPAIMGAVMGTRLIPAHAGKTCWFRHSWYAFRAHPRSRGENASQSTRVMSPRGSSPLTRGKRDPAARRRRAVRLIPAHAGKTIAVLDDVADGAAHPRSRGENYRSEVPSLIHDGSSPLTRGKPAYGLTRITHGRLIPAHAGKTASGGGNASAQSAHPRSRGEN